jgi:hypothetical protein
MNKQAAKSAVNDLRRSYAKAVLAFNTASATLILNLAANSTPAAEHIAIEEEARAAVLATRRELWMAYAKA